MWIEELKTGKLRAVERYLDPLTEKQKKVSVTIPDRKRKTLKAAEQLLAEKIEKLIAPETDRLTLEELSKLYLADCEKRLKQSTMDSKNGQVELVVYNLGKDIYIDKLTARAVSERLTVAGQVRTFKAMMRWAYQMDYIDSINFIDKITMPEYKHREGKKYLEIDELKALLASLKKEEHRDLTEFLALTGMRIGEATSLTIEDIDLIERTISITKTAYKRELKDTPKTDSSVREIYIQDDLLPLVRKLVRQAKEKALLTQCRCIFQRNGMPFSCSTYRSSILKHGVHPHMLRHTHTALMAAQGVSLEVISRRLGHKDSQITRQIYFHVTQKLRQKDHEAIKQVSIF